MSRGNRLSHVNSWIGYHRLSRTLITGYSKKRLGHPSERLSGDVPRATMRAVFFPLMVWPVITAVIFTIAYMFVKSFPDRNGYQPPNGPLVRIVVISIGPIIWNAGVLVIQLLVSLLMGPCLGSSSRFASTMASVVHALSLAGMIGFFEFLVCLCTTLIVLHAFSLRFFISSGFWNSGMPRMPSSDSSR